MKINTAGDLLPSIAGGLALVVWLPARSHALTSLTCWSIFVKKKKKKICIQAREVPENSRGVSGMFFFFGGGGIAEFSAFCALVHSWRK